MPELLEAHDEIVIDDLHNEIRFEDGTVLTIQKLEAPDLHDPDWDWGW